MALKSSALHLLPFLVFGCAGAVRQPQPSVPEPGGQEPTIQIPPVHSWLFSYASGVASYKVTRSAVVEKVSDPSSTREVTTNLTHETLTLEQAGDTIQFTMVADTFATTTQNLVGPAQISPVPIQVSGILVHDTLRIADDPGGTPCRPSQSVIRADVYNVVVPFPARLEQGMVWADSLEISGCQAAVQTTAHSRRSFHVSGEASYDGRPVIVVERTDTLQAHGEGAQQQHRVVLDASGTGSVLYYLSPSTGQILHATVAQELSLAITASGKVDSFRQSLKQEFALAH
jgi:hypothetical protein